MVIIKAANEDENIEIEDSNGVIDYYDVWSMDDLKRRAEKYICELQAENVVNFAVGTK